MPDTSTESAFARTLAHHSEEVTSPDGRINATVQAGLIKGLSFASGTYTQYTEPELQAQLVQLARLAWVSRERARQAGLRAANGESHEARPRVPVSSAERKLREERDAAQVSVSSANLTITIVGGTRWVVKIKPGTIRKLKEEEFLRELAMLVKRAMGSWRSTMSRLRDKSFGPSEILRDLGRSRTTS
ncbi:hypothetical protein [Stackebrandtia soli]|uniref:hypothetical protein n=1 Tax=Stackebrandtia soli TaxID=1892856 RepID=UPI0039EAEDAB